MRLKGSFISVIKTLVSISTDSLLATIYAYPRALLFFSFFSLASLNMSPG
ncbi:MAG: hypothetical protein QOJ02_1451 [Acidobacteriota bacterium]|jgi:hypothetical protein|nr:hypothetical protein [Acidobacteriota bacterium]